VDQGTIDAPCVITLRHAHLPGLMGRIEDLPEGVQLKLTVGGIADPNISLTSGALFFHVPSRSGILVVTRGTSDSSSARPPESDTSYKLPRIPS
jgi:hypothetical protein